MNKRIGTFIYICENDLSEPIGGTFHVKEVVEALGRKHPSLELIVPQYSKNSRLYLPAGVKIKKIRTPELPIIKWMYFYLRSSIDIVLEKLKSREKLVVYSREMPFNILLTLLCKMLYIPLFIEVNGILIEEIKSFKRSLVEYYVTFILERLNFSAGIGIISVSEVIKEEIKRYFKISEDKIAVIYNGVKIPKNQEDVSKIDFSKIFKLDNSLIIGFIGSCYPYHDILTLVEAAPAIIDKRSDVRFVIAGDGEMLKSWKEKSKYLGVDTYFYFPGYIQKGNVLAFINSFDICLSLRSRDVKGPGMKIFEYLLYNKPVIATYNKETKKMFADFKNICWVAPENPDSVYRGIMNVIKYPRNFSDPYSRNKIINNFTWGNTAQKILSVINEFIGESSNFAKYSKFHEVR